MADTNGNAPTHDLCAVSGEGRSAVWTRIAALWPTKDGSGFTGEIPAGVMVGGRVVIQKRQPRGDREPGSEG